MERFELLGQGVPARFQLLGRDHVRIDAVRVFRSERASDLNIDFDKLSHARLELLEVLFRAFRIHQAFMKSKEVMEIAMDTRILWIELERLLHRFQSFLVSAERDQRFSTLKQDLRVLRCQPGAGFEFVERTLQLQSPAGF